MTSCAYVVIYLPIDRQTIYVHKAWDHFLLLLGGQSRASNAVVEMVPTLLLLIFPKGIGKHIESQNEKTILFTAVYLIRD